MISFWLLEFKQAKFGRSLQVNDSVNFQDFGTKEAILYR